MDNDSRFNEGMVVGEKRGLKEEDNEKVGKWMCVDKMGGG